MEQNDDLTPLLSFLEMLQINNIWTRIRMVTAASLALVCTGPAIRPSDDLHLIWMELANHSVYRITSTRGHEVTRACYSERRHW